MHHVTLKKLKFNKKILKKMNFNLETLTYLPKSVNNLVNTTTIYLLILHQSVKSWQTVALLDVDC